MIPGDTWTASLNESQSKNMVTPPKKKMSAFFYKNTGICRFSTCFGESDFDKVFWVWRGYYRHTSQLTATTTTTTTTSSTSSTLPTPKYEGKELPPSKSYQPNPGKGKTKTAQLNHPTLRLQKLWRPQTPIGVRQQEGRTGLRGQLRLVCRCAAASGCPTGWGR